jgi:MFS family permease
MVAMNKRLHYREKLRLNPSLERFLRDKWIKWHGTRRTIILRILAFSAILALIYAFAETYPSQIVKTWEAKGISASFVVYKWIVFRYVPRNHFGYHPLGTAAIASGFIIAYVVVTAYCTQPDPTLGSEFVKWYSGFNMQDWWNMGCLLGIFLADELASALEGRWYGFDCKEFIEGPIFKGLEEVHRDLTPKEIGQIALNVFSGLVP